MKKWEKDYTTLKTKEQEDQEEVRVLYSFFSNPIKLRANREMIVCFFFTLVLFNNINNVNSA